MQSTEFQQYSNGTILIFSYHFYIYSIVYLHLLLQIVNAIFSILKNIQKTILFKTLSTFIKIFFYLQVIRKIKIFFFKLF